MRRFKALLTACALVLSPSVLAAQRSGGPPPGGNHSDAGGPGGGGGNHSDNGGPGEGGGNHSDNGGGNHSDNGGPGGHGEHGEHGGGISHDEAEAITAAQHHLLEELHSGRLVFTHASATGANSTVAATAHVANVLEGGSNVESVAQLTNALSQSGAPASVVAALVQSLQGIATTPAIAGPTGAPGRITTAANEFNALVHGASHDFLANPPTEFMVLHAALEPLVQALTLRGGNHEVGG